MFCLDPIDLIQQSLGIGRGIAASIIVEIGEGVDPLFHEGSDVARPMRKFRLGIR